MKAFYTKDSASPGCAHKTHLDFTIGDKSFRVSTEIPAQLVAKGPEWLEQMVAKGLEERAVGHFRQELRKAIKEHKENNETSV